MHAVIDVVGQCVPGCSEPPCTVQRIVSCPSRIPARSIGVETRGIAATVVGIRPAPSTDDLTEDAVVERGSAKHGFLKDEVLEREIENELRGRGPTREPWRQPDAEFPDEEEIEELGLDGPPRPELRDQ
jgi:hypothetical protein